MEPARQRQLQEDRFLFWVSWWAFVAVLGLALLAGASRVHAEENDVAIALRVAREYELSPFQTRVLLCTRLVENGRPGREYGVLHSRALNTTQINQAQWAAGTIKKRLPTRRDLTSFAARWAPMGAANDPHELNRHWIHNVEACLAQLTGGDDG